MKVALFLLSCVYAAINYKIPMSDLDLDLGQTFPSQYETTGNAVVLA